MSSPLGRWAVLPSSAYGHLLTVMATERDNRAMGELRWVPPAPGTVDIRRRDPVSTERLLPPDRPGRPDARSAGKDLGTPRRDHRPDGAPLADRRWDHADALARFDPGRAGLPEVGRDEAAGYLQAHRRDRPWLDSARHAAGAVQRVFAALDQGGGHAHIRHEGWLSAEKSQLRVLYLHDPAQLDPALRAEGTDGLLPGGKRHYCAEISTAIRDPAAFAVAFARGTEHPDVRRALETPVGGRKPEAVTVPIADLLGPDGHRYCEGYRLAGDDDQVARRERRIWLRETQAGEPPSVPPPLLVPVDFRGGVIEFRFNVNTARTGYEVNTMFPGPPRRDPDHR